jgi:penicillin-binding protein 1C
MNAKKVGILIGAAIFCFIVLPFVSIAWIVRELPTPNRIVQDARYSSTILDKNDKVIYQIFENKNIIPVSLASLPAYVSKATIAIEDKNFFQHGGFSIPGILRALVVDFIFRSGAGGSTMTQQLIKNTLLTSEKTLTRKIKEFILAVELERRFTKNQILEMYLNQIPYGGTAWGIESGSQYYFGVHAKDLTLLQAAVLAGLPQNPNIYSPFFGVKDAYLDRTKQVLRRMREDKYITTTEEKKLLAQLPLLKFKTSKNQIPALHFVFYVKDALDNLLANDALLQKGLVIKTTLDLGLQQEIEKIAKEEIAKAKGLSISNTAIVAIDPKTGNILAMVGSVDYNNDKFGKFNAALGLRQPGSTLKPFTYAMALEKGLTPASVLMDVSTQFTTQKTEDDEPAYAPVNYDGKFHGPIQLRFALGNSINIPAVKALALVGLPTFLQKISDAGLHTLAPTDANLKRFGLSLTLGGGEVRLLDLVSSYSVFANGGKTVKPQSLREVRDYQSKMIYEADKNTSEQVFTSETAFLISHILSDNNARALTFGTNSYLNVPGKTVAVKTGTTDDKRDNWTVGYSRDIIVGVWVGNNDNTQMNESLASGVSGAAPIWYRTMQYAFAHGYKDGIGETPSGVKAVEIDALFGGQPHGGDSKRSEYFVNGTEPNAVSPFYKKVKISKSTGKLANAIEIASGNYDEKDYYVVTEQDPVSVDGHNRWQEGIDAWAATQSDDHWKAPRDTSDTNADSISIKLTRPGDREKLGSNSVSVLAQAVSIAPISSFKFYVNGSLKKETTDSVIDETFQFSDGVYSLSFVATNNKNQTTQKDILIGVNQEALPSATPQPPTPTAVSASPTTTP